MKKKNFKLIKDLNIRAKAIKLWEDNIGVNLCDLGLGNGLLAMAPKAETKSR